MTAAAAAVSALTQLAAGQARISSRSALARIWRQRVSVAENPTSSNTTHSTLGAPSDAMVVGTATKQFAALRDQGILTEEEFAAKKAQILGI